MKVYRAILEIIDDEDPAPLTRAEIQAEIERSDPAGLSIRTIELTDITTVKEFRCSRCGS